MRTGRDRSGMTLIEAAAYLGIFACLFGGMLRSHRILAPWTGMERDVAHDVTGAMPASFASASFTLASRSRTEERDRAVVLEAKGADGSLHQIQMTPMAAYVLERHGRPEKER